MKISVVTISYNQDKFLEQCILSVKNQTYKNFEHIIVDAGSSDRSRKIIHKYKNYFSKVIFEKDRGPADGLNKGFKYATGSIYFFLNSDDLIPKNSFMLAINEFKKNDIDCLLGSGHLIDHRNKLLKFIIPTNFSRNEFIYNSAVVFQQGCFFRNNLFKKSKKFNLKSLTCWDGELILNFKDITKKIKISTDCLGFFRIYPESGTGSGLLKNKWKEDRARLFLKYKRRKLKKIDDVITLFYVVKKIYYNPKRTFMLIFSKIIYRNNFIH